MEFAKSKSRSAHGPVSVEQLLESYYGKLLDWGSVLARGDAGVARDIVHDLCLHFTLAKPDLSQVENLDGYLYTSLRNIYRSLLDRSSREAMHLVSIVEYDSIYFALRSSSLEGLLQRQNELRRICNYVTWRKASSKSASYLALLFFHGYTRREIADLAGVPVAAIYNKLLIARTELKCHLEESSRLTIARCDVPPAPEQRHSIIPFAELFDELRTRILTAKTTDCLPESQLLRHYQPPDVTPIPCSLLSHIVSCERCLTLLDRHFGRPTLADREPPVDSGNSMDRAGLPGSDNGHSSLMRSVRWHKEQIYEHRPRTLSIAVNGRITAFHDVQGQQSSLGARIDHPESAEFIEVFTEQQVRLALLPVGHRPPEGQYSQTQRVVLSDHRWLQLTLTFDGLGLHSEVTYADPALAFATSGDEVEDKPLLMATSPEGPAVSPLMTTSAPSFLALIRRLIQASTRPPALVWTSILAIVFVAGAYFAYERFESPSNPNELLSQSMNIETAELKGQIEHQVLRVEETGSDGKVVLHDTVDVWKESGTGRHMRRLYNAGHRLIAAEWLTSNGAGGSYSAPDPGSLSEDERAFAAGTLWRQDVSANAFRAIPASQLSVRKVDGNYELTASVPKDESHLVSATLVLNGRLRAVGEVLRIQHGSAVNVVRFVQADYDRRPASAFPGNIFDPTDMPTDSPLERIQPGATGASRTMKMPGSDVRLVQLHIAVLAALNKLRADVGEPFEIKKTREGRIRVSGTVADRERQREITAALGLLPQQELLDLHLVSQRGIGDAARLRRRSKPQDANIYTIEDAQPPADALVRAYFAGKGFDGNQVTSSAAQFSLDALGHAQHALQQAYALDRLGSDFSARDLQAVDSTFKHLWAEMAASHAAALQRELRALREQLTQLGPQDAQALAGAGIDAQIQRPEEFAHSVHSLLQQVQHLNGSIGMAFTSGPSAAAKQNAIALISVAIQSIPLRASDQVAVSTARLANATDGNTTVKSASERTPRQESSK